MSIPYIDVQKQTELTEAQIKYFNDNGFLVLRNALSKEELESLRAETKSMIDNIGHGPDYWYNDEIPQNWYKLHSHKQEKETSDPATKPEGETKRGVPFRIEYPVDKGIACKRLIAHSFVLKVIEAFLGPNFIPTWDSFVFKFPGNGVPIKWHRDASAASVDNRPAIDVGIYLDEANTQHDNCLYVVTGTHKWPDMIASAMIDHLTSDGFKKNGAIPVEVQPGDVILHNILVLHGSPACKSPLRRTVYYEYRSIEQELAMGPHKPEYVPLKIRVLEACLYERSQTNYDALINQPSYNYHPDPKYSASLPAFDPETGLKTLRYPHQEYFRSDYKG